MASSTALYDEILDLEEETWKALQRQGSDLLPFLTRDCIMQFPMGLKVTSRTEPSVQDILHSPAFVPWKTFRLSKVDVTPVGSEGAVISYRAIATRPPAAKEDTQDLDFDALCSSVWRFENGKWMVSFETGSEMLRCGSDVFADVFPSADHVCLNGGGSRLHGHFRMGKFVLEKQGVYEVATRCVCCGLSCWRGEFVWIFWRNM